MTASSEGAATADLKALHRAILDAVFFGDDPRAMEPFVAPMHELHQSATTSLPPGRGGAFWAVEKLRTAFGKAYVQIDHQTQTGDLVYTRFTARLQHTGRLAAARPTGEWVKVTAMVFSRFENGRARETWVESNDLDVLRQLDAFRVKPEARVAPSGTTPLDSAPSPRPDDGGAADPTPSLGDS